jgi:transposase
MKKRNSKVVFKDYSPNQLMLLPPSLEELIEPNHPVRIVNRVIETINADSLLNQYKGGGTSSYHPRMLLKVLIYSYLSNIFSSRKMEMALKENIHFMWLSGMNRPDHNTLNRFRSERLKDVLKEIFAQVVLLLVDSGHISLQEIYVDGTKIESKANRYTFVWGNAIKTNKAKISEQLKYLWNYAQEIAKEELSNPEVIEFKEINADKVQETITKIDEALKKKEIDKKVRQKLGYARKHWPENLKKYDRQQEILGKRNSYSKTDPEATFMRMKEDHMKNGQLKPGYNIQISTHDQYIVNYTHHQNPTDTTTLKSHMAQFEELYKQLPQAAIADAGYGSEENYTFLETIGIEAYIKYNYFDKDQKEKKDGSLNENLYYNKEKDCFYCAMGQEMQRIGTRQRITENGFEQQYARYQAINCTGCPLRGVCNRNKGNKVLEVNHKLNYLKSKAYNLLKSERGIYHRKKRCVDVEPVFANIKYNKGFKRFMLCGLKKTEIETGLLAIAHNLSKSVA